MRKLATIRKIDAIRPIEGADAIECAVIGGWTVVVKKGEYKAGDLAVYCEIDSWIPLEIAPFLQKGDRGYEYNGVQGNRLRTIKLRGQLSQGLLLPASIVTQDGVDGTEYPFIEGSDVTELLGIQKWERPVPTQLAGLVKGDFPSKIPKTDQERVQNLVNEIDASRSRVDVYEVTEKLEGSSMTCYLIDGEFGVCSRNLDLKRDENNAFWKTAIKESIEEKLRGVGFDVAIQGELIGPGIQGNIYKLSDTEFHIFDVFDIQTQKYFDPVDRRLFVEKLGLKHVPVISTVQCLDTVEDIITWADGKSMLQDTKREGIVFKHNDGGMTFKAISNEYLLKHGD